MILSYYPDARDEVPYVPQIIKLVSRRTGFQFTNELNIYFMHTCARYWKYGLTGRIYTKTVNYLTPHGESIPKPSAFLLPCTEYLLWVIQLQNSGDVD